ncbi:MAG: hypothetical protein ABIP53_09205 [Candidatus Limnocylindrales bacterium]
MPSPSGGGSGHAQETPALSVGRAYIHTWEDSFGRSRLQVILAVRNDNARWVRFPAAGSTFRIFNETSEVAGGAFVALPAVIGPGETAYLVDTVNVPVVELTRALSAESDVAALYTDAPTVMLSITGLRLTSGTGGGMRATGRVHNDGGAGTGPVIAGAIALDRNGRPLAAVYDTIDVGRVDPGDSRPFATDYEPGAPPVTAAMVDGVVGVAFEAE